MNKIKRTDQWIIDHLEELDDHDIPVTEEVTHSIRRLEILHGRGFWGNNKTGYIYDKDLNDE